jgi:hypothetical protein
VKYTSFLLDVRMFFDTCLIKYKYFDGCIVIKDFSVVIFPVAVQDYVFLPEIRERADFIMSDFGMSESIFIYEDSWITKGGIIKNRLLSRFGKGEAVFARNCRVKSIDQPVAKDFLNANHILGYARARYKYALFLDDTIVAVATFSASRLMERECGVVQSYEWVRYAAVGAVRVTGGMSKLLSHFVRSVAPDEVMSYADADWGVGSAYSILGFTMTERTKPVRFIVNTETFMRISEKKLLKENRCHFQEFDRARSVLFANSGNFKFIRLFV